MKRFIFVLLVILALGTVAKSQTQSDTSDAVWSIVMPQAESQNIDMGKVLLGESKDSLVSTFIKNTGSYKFRVDEIYFQGADASAFGLVSGFPVYEIQVGKNQYAEFRFIPNRVGLHQAEVVIITQADTLIQTITGEGVQPQLQVFSGILDFGEVELGNDKIIQDTVLLKNISSSPIEITNTVIMFPNEEQFNIISGGGAFTLQAGEERRLSLQFKPKYGGRTSGRIGFEYNGPGSPAIAQLFGTGIGGVIYIPNDSAFAGEKRTIHLVLQKIKPEGIQSLASSFSATLRFQGTILVPQDLSLVSDYRNDSIIVNVNAVIPNNTTLASIPCIAGLGSVEQTDVEILDFKFYDNSGNDIFYNVESINGTFKLLGICEEGGKRLLNPNNKVSINQIVPNPSSGIISVELNLIEKGKTSLSMYNSQGNEVYEKQIEGVTGNLKVDIETNAFSNGLYFIKLQTPTVIQTRQLVIVK